MGSSFKDKIISDMVTKVDKNISNIIKDCPHKTVQYIAHNQGYGCPDCGAFVPASDMADYPTQLANTSALFSAIVASTPLKAGSIEDTESWLKPKITKPWKTNPWKKINKKSASKEVKKKIKKKGTGGGTNTSSLTTAAMLAKKEGIPLLAAYALLKKQGAGKTIKKKGKVIKISPLTETDIKWLKDNPFTPIKPVSPASLHNVISYPDTPISNADWKAMVAAVHLPFDGLKDKVKKDE